MSKTTVNFIRAGLIYFMVASTLGVLLIIRGDWSASLRPAHVHLNLLGWVSMLIFGVSYHILPRFRGKTLHSEKMAEAQFWLANVGLVGMTVLWALIPSAQPWVLPGLTAFAIVELASLYLFVYNLLRTLA